jgi:hypothetical protein
MKPVKDQIRFLLQSQAWCQIRDVVKYQVLDTAWVKVRNQNDRLLNQVLGQTEIKMKSIS